LNKIESQFLGSLLVLFDRILFREDSLET